MAKAEVNFTETDLAIVNELRANGRASNQQIADRLDLTATTVSSRIKRMEDANQLRVVAVADFAAFGIDMLLRIGIDVEGRAASAVAEDLTEFPEILAIHVVTGRHDLDLLVGIQNFRELDQLLESKLALIEGVAQIWPTIVTDIIKYQFDIAPIGGVAP